LSGGLLAQKLGEKDPRNYSRICRYGSLIAWPCLIVGLTTDNFLLSIAMLFMKITFGESFWAPNLAMIKDSCKASEFGSFLGVYQAICFMSGAITTIVAGLLVNTMGFGATAVGLGKVIAGVTSVGYAGAILCWWRVGKLLNKKAGEEVK
jgi:hypothetical protein